MPELRNIITADSGMRYMAGHLELCSPAGRRVMLATHMMTDAGKIMDALDELEVFVDLVRNGKFSAQIESIRHALSQLHDIHGTLSLLTNAATLDDIGLFEVKHFSLLSESIRVNLHQCGVGLPEIPGLQEVVKVLDPENQQLPQFYIYNVYSDELAYLRKQQQYLLQEQPDKADFIRLQCIEKEDEIRKQLSLVLSGEAPQLHQAHENLAKLDVLIAKAIQAVAGGLCKPQVSGQSTEFTGLFNPGVKALLAQQNKEFQPVNITVNRLPGLITGMNMGGKTVLLRTVALAQYLFQFGFYVPAAEASMVPVEEVMLSIDAEQSEYSGLSSFAAEMLRINEILGAAISGRNILALIDEPARTTNPDEGRALVNALISLLARYAVRSLVTTHFGSIQAPCHKMRVKGLSVSGPGSQVSLHTLNNYMDYTLLEPENGEVPHEALRIATVLGVHQELIDQATAFLSSMNNVNANDTGK
ncbi:MAG: DNA mismatch repair protein MutS [Bacteroidales bacterium]|nr:DNA mismatch repair protein MutS [Bacteroidales bacterium]